jgi:hypothetical protein
MSRRDETLLGNSDKCGMLSSLDLLNFLRTIITETTVLVAQSTHALSCVCGLKPWPDTSTHSGEEDI